MVAASCAGPIHLLLTDIVMPEMNGPNLAQRLIRDRPDLKVLYVSGFPHKALETGRSLNRRVAFLAKPFSSAVLASAVRACLEG